METSFDPREFRRVLGTFATGVTVVTTVHEGVPQAMTVNSFSSVSLDPPLVLFCADRRTRTHGAVAASGFFAVNVLAAEQRALSDLFAGKGTDEDRRAVLGRATAVTGAPILDGTLAWLDCRVAQAHDAGDHVIYVGQVVAMRRAEAGAPLLFYLGTYKSLTEG